MDEQFKYINVVNNKGVKINHRKIKSQGLDLDYYSNFLTPTIGNKLFNELENEVTYLHGENSKIKVWGRWYDLPRQQAAFGDPGLTYNFSGISVPALPWPKCIIELKNDLTDLFGFGYNFVLINRYRNGKDHIGAHRDDEKMLNKDIPIASISLGQHRDFVFHYKDAHQKVKDSPIKINLEHGSLLLMNPPTNTYWCHSLPVRKTAPGVRINLTFRCILN